MIFPIAWLLLVACIVIGIVRVAFWGLRWLWFRVYEPEPSPSERLRPVFDPPIAGPPLRDVHGQRRVRARPPPG